MRRCAAALLLAGLLAGCSSVPDAAQRWAAAQAVAGEQQWQPQALHTPTFTLQSWAAAVKPVPVLTVYVEGDGLAWLDGSTPSGDPTPTQPLVLRLAMAQPQGVAVYLARPCQYTLAQDSRCSAAAWTNARFSPEVVLAMNAALDQLKQQYQAQRLVLVGYSGGAAVTALLAEQRSDIAGWVTVAGNIDVNAWAQYHRLSPLAGSLDPMAASARLQRLAQWHFVGERDAVVPPALVRAFARHMPQAQVIERPGYDHTCCWAADWARQYPSGR